MYLHKNHSVIFLNWKSAFFKDILKLIPGAAQLLQQIQKLFGQLLGSIAGGSSGGAQSG